MVHFFSAKWEPINWSKDHYWKIDHLFSVSTMSEAEIKKFLVKQYGYQYDSWTTHHNNLGKNNESRYYLSKSKGETVIAKVTEIPLS